MYHFYFKFAYDAYDDREGDFMGYSVKLFRIGCDVLKVYEDEQEIIFSFRGSDDVKDWISNLRQGGLWCEMHQGFIDSFERFKSVFKEILLLDCGKKVTILGHSRGAALATLAAHYVAKEMKLPCYCFAFESPRVAKKPFRDEYNMLQINHVTVRNGWDIVTYLPLWVLGYRHVGRMQVFKKPFWHRFLKFMISDHLKENCIKSYFDDNKQED